MVETGFNRTEIGKVVLPAYLMGMVLAPYFLKAGSLVKFETVVSAVGLILILLGVKMVTKFIGVWPLAKVFRFEKREAVYKKISHGLDGSKSSSKALAEAIDVAEKSGAELHTISIEEVPRYAVTICSFQAVPCRPEIFSIIARNNSTPVGISSSGKS